MTVALELDDLSVAFNRGTIDELWALRGLTLRVETSDYISIIGPNGAGKSTLLNAVAGVMAPSSGVIAIDGTCVNDVPEHRRARRVARVMQDPQRNTCADLTLRENLIMGATRGHRRSPFRRAYQRGALEGAIEGLERYAPSLSKRLDQQVATLSGGQRQVLALVMAVSARPAILLLDEHTSALDPEVAARVMELTDALIAGANVTTLMVTHNMRQAAAHGKRILLMARGEARGEVSGAEKASMQEPELIERFRAAVRGEISDRLLSE